MLDEIDARLMAWGRWTMRARGGAEGYPRRTLEARLRDEGGVLISGTGGARLEPVDSGAEQIERIIASLGRRWRDGSTLLIWYYAMDCTMADVARRMGVSESLLKNKWLPRAKMFVAGALDQANIKAA